MKSINSSYIPAVDHMRALAAILVIFQHSHAYIGGRLAYGPGGNLANAPASSPIDAVMTEGHTGVALFMVLSGFIFTHIAYGKHVRYGAFLLNRILRIYPLMIAVFTVGFLVLYPEIDPTGFLATIGIPFQIQFPVDLWFVPILYPFTSLYWTLAPEFQFYLLFPLILALVHRDGPVVLVVLIAGALLLRVLLVADGAPAQDLSYYSIFGRIDQFLIGMGAALAYRALTDRRLPLLLWVSLAVLPLLLFAFNQVGSLKNQSEWKVLWPTLEALLWAGFVIGYMEESRRLPDWLSRGLASVGEVSFSMYLLHMAVIAAVFKLGLIPFHAGPVADAFLNGLLLVLPLTVAVSWITFRVIERPFLMLRVRYLEGRQRGAGGVPAPNTVASAARG
jgi:peptidoglycan/LPS O-acetylase OafA/YrhL